MRVCGAGGCGFQAQVVKDSDRKRGALRLSPLLEQRAAQKPRAEESELAACKILGIQQLRGGFSGGEPPLL